MTAEHDTNLSLWQSLWGDSYRPWIKANKLEAALCEHPLPLQDCVSLDIGCGANPLSLKISHATTQGYHSVLVDYAYGPVNSKSYRKAGTVLNGTDIPINATVISEDIRDVNRRGSEARHRLESALAAQTRDGRPLVDCVFLSDILNYVPYMETIESASALLRESGILIVLNKAGWGYDFLFDTEDGVKSDQSVINTLAEAGMNVLPPPQNPVKDAQCSDVLIAQFAA